MGPNLAPARQKHLPKVRFVGLALGLRPQDAWGPHGRGVYTHRAQVTRIPDAPEPS